MITDEDRIQIITALKFLQFLQQLKTYLDKTRYLHSFIKDYAQKTVSLQNLKISLLHNSSLNKNDVRKNYTFYIEIINSSTAELEFFRQLQTLFKALTFLVHYSKFRLLYIDINALKEQEFEVIIYHAR